MNACRLRRTLSNNTGIPADFSRAARPSLIIDEARKNIVSAAKRHYRCFANGATQGLIFLFPFLFALRVITGRKNVIYSFISRLPRVISGEYSIVGPRNEAAAGEPWLGKKGLTGFWFTDIDEDEDSVKSDIFYAKNQNIWLDLEIIGKTFNKLMNER